MKKGKSSKSWKEKMEGAGEPKIVTIPEKWARRIGHGKMLVPSPKLVDRTVKKIKKGKLATMNLIREKLADDFHADMTCPLTTGLFLNIAANAAEEDKKNGKINITPYWRVLKVDGSLNPKFPGGLKRQSAHLKEEGFDIIAKKGSSKTVVKNYKTKLVSFS